MSIAANFIQALQVIMQNLIFVRMVNLINARKTVIMEDNLTVTASFLSLNESHKVKLDISKDLQDSVRWSLDRDIFQKSVFDDTIG